MTIEIKRPEIETIIQQMMHSSAFESVEDVLFDALELQGEREAWLQENKEAINAKIERGLAQLDRAKVYRGRGCAGDLKPTWQRGSRTALSREKLTSSLRTPQTTSNRFGVTSSARQGWQWPTGFRANWWCLRGLGRRSRQRSQASRPNQ
jgi:hypothetical protein